MSNTCLKTFTLNVGGAGPSPANWWKMEETGSNDRIDVINGLILRPTRALSQWSNAAGRVNQGVRMQDPFLNEMVLTLQNPFLQTPDYTSGFHYVFWLKLNIVDPSIELLVVNAFGSANQITMLMTPGNILVAQDFNNPAPSDFNVAFTPSVGVWYFFNLFWSATNNKFGLSINDGLTHLSPVAVPLADASAIQLFLVDDLVDTNAVYDQVLDEVGYYRVALKPAQITYLYNGGNGRTWPFSIPP